MDAEHRPTDPKRSTRARDRVTIDLRGMGARLHALASRRRMPASVLVRRSVVAMLEAEFVEGVQHGPAGEEGATPVVKVTLRLSADHAQLLAARARAADVSQGSYVASLIEGLPVPPLPPDHARAIEALLVFSNRLADVSPDLNGIARLVTRDPKGQLGQHASYLTALAARIRQHLALAAELLTSVRPRRGHR